MNYKEEKKVLYLRTDLKKRGKKEKEVESN